MLLKTYKLEIAVFTAGAVVMVLELVGSRLLAPYLGTSIIVWTSLIGVILGSLSWGYWWGGRLADKNPNYKTFSLIFFWSAVFIGAAAVSNQIISLFISFLIRDIRLGSLAAAFLIFALPSALLGMISPYAMRLKMKDMAHSGATAGNLYAISTIGSIVGTFLAGFFLIGYFGSINIVFILALVMAAASILVYWDGVSSLDILLIICLVAGASVFNFFRPSLGKDGIADVDTAYNRVFIRRSAEPVNSRPVLLMSVTRGETESAMFLDNDNDLAAPYTKFYRLSDYFKPGFSKALVIGGAGYSFPKDLLRNHPDVLVDVVEIDPGLTLLAKKYFNLKDDPRLTVYHEDGRTFLNRTKNKYNVIFGDAYKSTASIPWQLTTIEATQKIYDSLTDSGAAFLNIISSVEGDTGKFLRAEYATYKAIFPQVYLFLVDRPGDGQAIQNIMLVALKSKEKPAMESRNKEMNFYLSRLWKKEVVGDLPVLTDNFAPADIYIMPVIKEL